MLRFNFEKRIDLDDKYILIIIRIMLLFNFEQRLDLHNKIFNHFKNDA